MNPVAMSIMNPHKKKIAEPGDSNKGPPLFRSSPLLTGLHRLGILGDGTVNHDVGENKCFVFLFFTQSLVWTQTSESLGWSINENRNFHWSFIDFID